MSLADLITTADQVRGPVTNRTWQSIGLRWVQPNLDETVTLFPEQRGGLEMYVNLEKVRWGH